MTMADEKSRDSKSDNYSRDFGSDAPSGRPGAQSPQASRGTAQDYEDFQKGDVSVQTIGPDPEVKRSFDEFPGKNIGEDF